MRMTFMLDVERDPLFGCLRERTSGGRPKQVVMVFSAVEQWSHAIHAVKRRVQESAVSNLRCRFCRKTHAVVSEM